MTNVATYIVYLVTKQREFNVLLIIVELLQVSLIFSVIFSSYKNPPVWYI